MIVISNTNKCTCVCIGCVWGLSWGVGGCLEIPESEKTVPVVTGVLIISTCQLLLTSSITTYKHTHLSSVFIWPWIRTRTLLQANPSSLWWFQVYPCVYSLVFSSVYSPATCSLLECQSTELCASSANSAISPSAIRKRTFVINLIITHKLFQLFITHLLYLCPLCVK